MYEIINENTIETLENSFKLKRAYGVDYVVTFKNDFNDDDLQSMNEYISENILDNVDDTINVFKHNEKSVTIIIESIE